MKLTKRSNGIWMVEWTDEAGKRRRKSTSVREHAEAKSKAAEIISGKPDANRDFFTMDEALDEIWDSKWKYDKSSRSKGYLVEAVRRKFGPDPVDTITYAKVKDWITAMRRAGMAPTTINNKVSVLSRALREAAHIGKLASVPQLPRVEMRLQEPRWATEEEEGKLKDTALHLNDAAKRPQGGGQARYPETGFVMIAVIDALIQTGMRLSELIRSRPQDRITGGLKILDGKNGTSVESIPLTPAAARSLEYLWEHPTWQAVTEGVNGPDDERRKVRRGSAADWIIKRFTTIRNRAGLRDLSIHKLRHTTASRLVQKGVDLYKVQRFLRHSSPAMTQRYAHLTVDDLQETAALLSPEEEGESASVIQFRKKAAG